ncbi:MAG: hypothetical protein WC273_07020 [Dehalococcoidia bacterium]
MRTLLFGGILSVIAMVAMFPVTITGGSGHATALAATGTATPYVWGVVHDAEHNLVTSLAQGSTFHPRVGISGYEGTPTGVVTPALFAGGDCSGAPVTPSPYAPVTLVDGLADIAPALAVFGVDAISITIAYSGDDAYAPATSNCAAVALTTPPVLNVSNASVDEGDRGVTTATFTARLTVPGERPVMLDMYTTNSPPGAPNAASAGVDYLHRSAMHVKVQPGEAYTFKIRIRPDTEPEADETFRVRVDLLNPGWGGVGPGRVTAVNYGTGTIADDDAGVGETVPPGLGGTPTDGVTQGLVVVKAE